MKLLISLAACLTLGTSALANAALEAASPPADAQASDKLADAKPNWTVVGEWEVKHPNWNGTLTIRADGTFSRKNGDGGKWRLTADHHEPALQLIWDAWGTEIAQMITPDLFRGQVRKGAIELRRGGNAAPEEVAATPPAQPPEGIDAPELKKKLSDSTWELRDGKHFTLHADGSTTGDWHNRKGFWRITSPTTVQLTIQWRDLPPATVTLNADATVLRWSDEEWGQIARRVAADAAKP